MICACHEAGVQMPDMLGHFELRGEFGPGAVAAVRHACDPALKPEAAIKEPVIAPGASPEAAADLGARFVREGRAAATRGSIVILTPFRVLPGGGCDLRRDDSFAGVTMQGRDD